jgi:arsenical pump membrane protein
MSTLFLNGMMLLAEVARREGLFDWLAAHAAIQARESARRLLKPIYLVGPAVTVLLSDDANAVVLTPAVGASARAVGWRTPCPICSLTTILWLSAVRPDGAHVGY